MSDQLSPVRGKCPECVEGLMHKCVIDETFECCLGGDEKVTVHAAAVPVYRCDRCKLQMSGPPAARVRHEAICKAAGLLTPREVTALRLRLGLTQEEFAGEVGVAVDTVSRVERGRLIQDRITDGIFRQLDR